MLWAGDVLFGLEYPPCPVPTPVGQDFFSVLSPHPLAAKNKRQINKSFQLAVSTVMPRDTSRVNMVEVPGRVATGGWMPLTASQRSAIEYRGKNLQLIACAGSGKTEVVAARSAPASV